MKVPKISKSYFLYFLMLSFVFIATTALSLSKIEKIKPEEKLVSDKIETKDFIPNPILKENSNRDLAFNVNIINKFDKG